MLGAGEVADELGALVLAGDDLARAGPLADDLAEERLVGIGESRRRDGRTGRDGESETGVQHAGHERTFLTAQVAVS